MIWVYGLSAVLSLAYCVHFFATTQDQVTIGDLRWICLFVVLPGVNTACAFAGFVDVIGDWIGKKSDIVVFRWGDKE